MYKRLLLPAAAACLIAAGAWAASPGTCGTGSPSAAVLIYHRVGDSRHPTTNVTIEAFRRQMRWLREEGFEVVPTRSLEAFLREGKPLPPKAVVLQFDDGFRSVYEKAFPVLKEYGYPFTVFLPVDVVEGGYPDVMTWRMVEEMAASGAEIGAHTLGHGRLGVPGRGEGPDDYAARVRQELTGGADVLRRRGYEPRWIAYPFGEYNEVVLREAVQAGFRLGFTQDPGAAGPESDPMALPRFAVVGAVADFDLFKERLTYRPMSLAARYPSAGAVGVESPAKYSARVAHPERYLAEGANLFVSELGRLEAHFNPSTGIVEAMGGGKLTRRINRVLVSLKEKDTGCFALASWILLRNP